MKLCSIKWCHTNFVKYRNFWANNRTNFCSNPIYRNIYIYICEHIYYIFFKKYENLWYSSVYRFLYAKDVLNLINEKRGPIDNLEQQVIGKTRVLLDGDSKNCRWQECNMGNLICDAVLDYVRFPIDKHFLVAKYSWGRLMCSFSTRSTPEKILTRTDGRMRLLLCRMAEASDRPSLELETIRFDWYALYNFPLIFTRKPYYRIIVKLFTGHSGRLHKCLALRKRHRQSFHDKTTASFDAGMERS